MVNSEISGSITAITIQQLGSEQQLASGVTGEMTSRSMFMVKLAAFMSL
jgi:hypothetical protein